MNIEHLRKLASNQEDSVVRRVARQMLEKHGHKVASPMAISSRDVRSNPGILRRVIEVLLAYHGDRHHLVLAMSQWRLAKGWKVLGSPSQDLINWVKGVKPNYRNAEMLATMYNETL